MYRIPPLQRGLRAIHQFISTNQPAQGLDEKARRVCSYFLKNSVKKITNILHLKFLRQARDSGILPKGTLNIKINSSIATPKLSRMKARFEAQAYRELVSYRIYGIRSSNYLLLNLKQELSTLPGYIISYTKWLTGQVCKDTEALLKAKHSAKLSRRYPTPHPPYLSPPASSPPRSPHPHLSPSCNNVTHSQPATNTGPVASSHPPSPQLVPEIPPASEHTTPSQASSTPSSTLATDNSNNQVWINLTNVTVSETQSQLLDKGLNYVPYPDLSPKTTQQFELALDAWAYRVRWTEWHKTFTSPHTPRFPPHPFDKPRNNPPPANAETENTIASLKMSVLHHVNQHIAKYKSRTSSDIATIRALKEHPHIDITTTDKTKKFALCNPGYIDTKREELVSDQSTYKHEPIDPTAKIEKDANALWSRICNRRDFSKQDLTLFKSFWSRPSELKVSLKDHKSTFPNCKGRPIQPVQGQATEKLDWIASLILQQLLNFVPTHISSSQVLRDRLRHLQPSLPVDTIHFSLDVESLYPSCPTSLDGGINHVINFIQLHMDNINMYGLQPMDIADLLNFTFKNTLTRIKDKLYRQIQGVAMGSHSGAAYSILVLNHYEQLAFSQLQSKFLQVFRYIDDYYILTDSIETKDTLFSLMNDLHPNLNFTIEMPNTSSSLNFLDMSITLSNGSFNFLHYQKDTHSGRYLHWTSAHPPRTRINIIRTETARIIENCNRSLLKAAPFLQQLEHQLRASMYPLHIIKKHISAICNQYRTGNQRQQLAHRPSLRNSQATQDKNLLRVPYIDPILSRLIQKEVRRHNTQIWLVEHVSPTLQSRLVTYNKQSSYGSCNGCPTCAELGRSCTTRYVVYQLTCELCSKIYIGKTYRPIITRLKEHNSSARLGNRRTAAGEHVLDDHPEIAGTGVDPFKQRKVLRVTSNRLDLLNAELQEIARRCPSINTQHRR